MFHRRLLFGLLVLICTDMAMAENQSTHQSAIFAGGCFWCMEPPFDELDGVLSTVSGYSGGSQKDPNYEQVSSGRTGHAEVIRIAYDPSKVSYEKLLEVFWHNIDPFDRNGQFCDKGNQYRSAIFYESEEQKLAAEKSKKNIEKRLSKAVVTEVTKAGEFYPAEEYHQDYYKKNSIRYKYYRYRCGRDKRLKEVWGAVVSK